MTKKKLCFQHIKGVNGVYQPNCSGEQCMWYHKCKKATVEIELPEFILNKYFGVNK